MSETSEKIIVDVLGEIHKVVIDHSRFSHLFVEAYHEGENSAYMNFQFREDGKIYLSFLYCYRKYRGRKIASQLSQIADEILSSYVGYEICGEFLPTIPRDDLDEENPDWEDLTNRAYRFYKKNGYTVVSYNDFVYNPHAYPELTEDSFLVGKSEIGTLIYKKINPKVKLRLLRKKVIDNE